MVSLLLQAPEHVRFPGLDQVFETTVPAHVRIRAGEHATCRLRTDRGLREALGEERSSSTEGIDMGSLDGSIERRGAAERVVPELVRHENH